MKAIFCTLLFLLFTVSIFPQGIIFPGQNQLYRFLEDPSYISLNKNYNMTGVLQASDSEVAQTSQYLAAQLSFFDNVAFGVDYSKHSFDSQRYSQFLISSRVRLGLGSDYHYVNLGFSVGPDKSYEVGSATVNSISTAYRLGGHYTNYNLTLGGFMNRYPIKYNSLSTTSTQPLTTTDGYSLYVAYNIALLDDLRFTPTVRYNAYDDLNFFEGIAMFNYKGSFEMAVSYKNDYSIHPAISARIFKRIKISYSYEKSMGSQLFQDIHGLGISVDLGSKATDDPEWLVNVKKKHSKIQQIKKVEKVVEVPNPETENKVSDLMEETLPIAVTDDTTETPKPMSENDPEDTINNRLKSGYYIVLGSFKILDNATREVERLKSKGYYARIGKKDTTGGFNYVYVDRYTDKNMATQRIKDIKKEKGLENTWILIIE